MTKSILLLVLASRLLSAQDFNLETRKGNIVMHLSEKEFGKAFFTPHGTLSNTTDFDMRLTYRVAFYDASGQELTSLCTPHAFKYCENIQPLEIPARRTVALQERLSKMGVNPEFFRDPANESKVSNYRMFFRDGQYLIKWSFALTKPKPSSTFSYEDELVNVVAIPNLRNFELSIKNKTANPLTINWNNVSWVDDSGEAHKMVPTTVSYATRNLPQPPTVIPPQARINQTIIPPDYVEMADGGLSIRPFWPEWRSLLTDSSPLKKREGKTFSLFLPLDRQGKITNYSFVFTIISVGA